MLKKFVIVSHPGVAGTLAASDILTGKHLLTQFCQISTNQPYWGEISSKRFSSGHMKKKKKKNVEKTWTHCDAVECNPF